MAGKAQKRRNIAPIKHWSHSSLMSFLRNPLAWYKRYVELIYDMPSTPSSVVGRAGHLALQHFYGGLGKEASIALGLEYLRGVADFELDFGAAKTRAAQKKKRESMEREYLQVIGFYLARPPRHKVLGVEVKGTVRVRGLPLPLKSVSDLVVVSRVDPNAVDIIDHKFVDSFSKYKADKTLFLIQAIFNYYTVLDLYDKPVKRFIIQECKKSRNADGSSQMRRYVIEYEKNKQAFTVFHRLIKDATAEIMRPRLYLPNPSDMFEGEHSFDLYRLELIEED